jgi:N-acetylglucosaminyl-diphospho-decaprenol L-rhamnosyltransferase
LQNCIDALAAQSLAGFEAIIVDNESSDGSAKALRLPDDRFRVHLAQANLGFAAANNLAATDCKSPWVATLNPDAIAGKTWLEELRSATLRHPGVRVFGSASGSSVSALPPDDREVFAPCAAAAIYDADGDAVDAEKDDAWDDEQCLPARPEAVKQRDHHIDRDCGRG